MADSYCSTWTHRHADKSKTLQVEVASSAGATMKITGQLTLTVVLFVLPPVFGCRTMRSDTTVEIPTVESPQDQALSKSVRDRLLADKKVDLTGVKVVSNNGTVYLTGTVSSLDARQQALKITWDVRGVQSVVNSLEVQK
jgi:osmotically-inducible protein OsmY